MGYDYSSEASCKYPGAPSAGGPTQSSQKDTNCITYAKSSTTLTLISSSVPDTSLLNYGDGLHSGKPTWYPRRTVMSFLYGHYSASVLVFRNGDGLRSGKPTWNLKRTILLTWPLFRFVLGFRSGMPRLPQLQCMGDMW